MDFQDAPLIGASDVLATNAGVRAAYDELRDVLERSTPPSQEKKKAQARFVYDQTALQERLRIALKSKGWARGLVLAPAVGAGRARTRVPELKSDMIKAKVHVVFEFGNKASYSSNLLGRVAFGFVTNASVIAVLVTPTKRFADQIDTNLTTYERVLAEVGRLAAARPSMLPGPLVIVGVEPSRDLG